MWMAREYRRCFGRVAVSSLCFGAFSFLHLLFWAPSWDLLVFLLFLALVLHTFFSDSEEPFVLAFACLGGVFLLPLYFWFQEAGMLVIAFVGVAIIMLSWGILRGEFRLVAFLRWIMLVYAVMAGGLVVLPLIPGLKAGLGIAHFLPQQWAPWAMTHLAITAVWAFANMIALWYVWDLPWWLPY